MTEGEERKGSWRGMRRNGWQDLQSFLHTEEIIIKQDILKQKEGRGRQSRSQITVEENSPQNNN